MSARFHILSAVVLTISIAAAGCGSADSNGGGSDLPWVTLSEDDFSSTSSGGALDAEGKPQVDKDGNHVLRFSGTNTEFASVLEDISSRFEVSIVVRPKELATRGITIETTGADAQAVLQDLAKQCKLQLEDLGDKKWRLSTPGSESAAEETISLEEE
jgi:hypothetical protein